VAVAWRAAADKELGGPTRAMDQLHRFAIEFACQQGCRFYNMGESGGVESLMKFKARFGATPRPVDTYRLERLPVTPIRLRFQAVRRSAESAVVGIAGRARGGTPDSSG
jgi:hypothetical protein